MRFNNPFDYEPHPFCLRAVDEVKCYVESQPELLADAQHGKMFGVLIVENGFLAAYSGLLAGRNDWPFFVPPVFDAQQPDGHFKQTERHISAINAQLDALAATSEKQEVPTIEHLSSTVAALREERRRLSEERRRLSEELQLWLFRQYRMRNARGEEKDLVDIWRDYHRSPKIRERFPLPPGGSGDCCAPKLLQYAYLHDLRPLAIAEFWYGDSPRGEVRHHGQFYPACRGKCLPILTFMLQGLDVEEGNSQKHQQQLADSLKVVYVDDSIIVVDKPSGLLSVQGRIDAPSVQMILAERYGDVWMPHRLDMDTSGLLVVARTEAAYKNLQQQFYARTIYKRYEALLDGLVEGSGTIALALRPDPLDRPRQVVDNLHGKTAVTDYTVLDHHNGQTLISLIPHTGRTHQLRVHCAHPEGLNVPIMGDTLYGRKGHRLCLHAAELSFTHPTTDERLRFESKEANFQEDVT